MKTHEHNRIVEANEIDELKHVNNIVYLKWAQEIAHQHWKELTKDTPQNKYIWMVIRHEIDYKNQAVLGDFVTVKTWVGETKGVKSIRFVEVFREEILLATVQTTFCMVDAKTHKPARITKDIINLLQ